MSYLADINILSGIVDKLLQYSDKHQVRVNDAITAISKAWNFTYDYLYNQKGEIVVKTDLADLWNEAAAKTRLVDTSLGRKLKEKGRFWVHPTLPRQNRILLLKEITDEIERLEKKLK
jgi:hypothetical protein